MSNILEQIQELKEQFDNLFEVEGLGTPAVDVPPSQNKIKRDRKTKDGKVEVVSVEDELFPYEGNKREQYRQKILDTINNMIQGTATLEDLLQIVRQKKAPLKEAMELMEDTISYIQKQEQPILKKGRANALRKLSNNSELKNKFKKLGKEDAEMVSAAFNSKKDQEKLEKLGSLRRKAQDVKMKDWQQMGNPRRKTKNEIGAEKTEARRYGETYREDKGYDRVDTDEPIPYHIGDSKGYPHYEEPKSDKQRIKDSIARHEKKNSLKEAMELMEDIRSAIEKKHGKPEYYSGRSPWQVGREPANKSAELTQKANEIKEKEALQAAERELDKDRPDLKDAHPAKKNYKVADYYGQIMARRNGKAPLKEAMELMEDLFDTILKQPAEKQGSLVYKYHQAKNKENAGKDTYTQAKEEEKRKSKEEKGQEKTEQRKKYRGKSTEDWKQGRLMDQIAKNAANLAKVSDPATAKAIRRNAQRAALKEAMEVLEELIGEGRNLEDVVVRSYDKGKVSLDDLQKLMDKAHEVPSDSSYFHKSKGEKGELSTKRRHMDYERNILSDGWGKDDNKKIEASIKRKAKNDKSFPVFQALKAYKEGKADLKEALEIMEAIINEVSERTKIDAYKKRANQSKFVGDIAKDTAKWHMDRGAYGPAIEVLKKADTAQKKEFKHRLNTMLHDKAFGQDAYNKAEKELHDEWKAKKDVKEALSLTEEIINEVSVGALARAVENNLPKRKKNEEVAIKAYKQAQNEYEKGSKESPEDEPALYKKLQCTDKAACKEFDKARDAENLKDLNLPKDSKVSANKLFNAAKKVNPERQKKTEETVKNTKGTKEDAKKFLNSLKRDNRSFDISLADPVKSRNEAN